MIACTLYRLSAGLRCRIIRSPQGTPYLERYHLLRLPGIGRLYLHRFLASDPDRGLHDHPWPWAISLLLAGAYREIRPGGARRRGPASIALIRGHERHRVLLEEREAWTLFAHGPKTKGWGFWRGGRYLPHEEALGEAPHHQWWRTAARARALRRTGEAAGAPIGLD